MKPILTVLGGSSPFTAAFVDSLQAMAARLPAYELVLHGRHRTNLQLVERYANRQLTQHGWTTRWTDNLDTAVSGATIIVHQIRYGGMELRAAGERLCSQYHVPADETLGPAALLSGMPMVAQLRAVCEQLKRMCPDAWVLNLTNPLSAVTAVMHEFGVQKCIGLCELPRFTLSEVAHVLELEPSEIQWSYSGLNHRGFLFDFHHQGESLFDQLLDRLSDDTIGGITAEQIKDLGAVPLKYFKMLCNPATATPARAEYLMDLREKIVLELQRSPDESPPSLAQRYLEWYPQAVVPMIAALNDDGVSTLVLNVTGEDGMARESLTRISRSEFETLVPQTCPPAVSEWTQIFERHERSFLQTIRLPNIENVKQTLLLDPTVPDNRVDALTSALWNDFERTQSQIQEKKSA